MNLVINSQFRPFTYDEMIKPLVQYKEAYDKTEQDYSNLLAQTEALKNIAERDNNPVAYDMYNRYSNDLKAIVDDFSKGMNINNRRALIKMKGRYLEDIQPIADASKKRDELAAEQRKLSASNPDLMYDRDFASEVTIDELIENPGLSYNITDGRDLYTKGQAIAKAMASRLQSINPAMGGQYHEIKQGFGEDAANKFLIDSNAIPELNTALQELVKSSGVTDKNAERAYQYAKQGAISGMVQTSNYQVNKSFKTKEESEAAKLQVKSIKQQLGLLPYRTDDSGTEYFYNKNTGAQWKKLSDGTVEVIQEGGVGSSDEQKINQIKERLIPDPTYGNYGIYRDPYKTKNNLYFKDADDNIRSITEADILRMNPQLQQDVKLERWKKEVNYDAIRNPVPIAIGKINTDDDPVIGVNNTSKAMEEYRKAYTSNKIKLVDYETLSKSQKTWVNDALKAKGGIDVYSVIIEEVNDKLFIKPKSTSENNGFLDPNFVPNF